MPRRMEQVEVNVTTEGMIDIVQEYAHGEDSVITVSPQQVPALVEMLQGR